MKSKGLAPLSSSPCTVPLNNHSPPSSTASESVSLEPNESMAMLWRSLRVDWFENGLGRVDPRAGAEAEGEEGMRCRGFVARGEVWEW